MAHSKEKVEKNQHIRPYRRLTMILEIFILQISCMVQPCMKLDAGLWHKLLGVNKHRAMCTWTKLSGHIHILGCFIEEPMSTLDVDSFVDQN